MAAPVRRGPCKGSPEPPPLSRHQDIFERRYIGQSGSNEHGHLSRSASAHAGPRICRVGDLFAGRMEVSRRSPKAHSEKTGGAGGGSIGRGAPEKTGISVASG